MDAMDAAVRGAERVQASCTGPDWETKGYTYHSMSVLQRVYVV